ncbi:MAG: LysR family transcriptional regulator [Bacteroidetes bacterium]|nr:LysR family transcriptional regulator [Bacteroidota bacterium]
MDQVFPEPKGRIWLETEGENFIGTGRVELLEKIGELGSLRKAAIAMGMSYRKAYYAIKSVNRLSSSPLVTFSHGGKGGGATIVTAAGRSMIGRFRSFEISFVKFLTDQEQFFREE